MPVTILNEVCKDVFAKEVRTCSKLNDCPGGEGFNFKRFCLSHTIEESINEERMNLWGEYDQVTDDELIQFIIPALKRAKWTALDLRRSPLTIAGVEALLKAIPSSSIKELCLGGMGFGNEGIEIIAKALPSLTKVENLNLFDNNVTNCGLFTLCKTLPRSSVKVLNLDNNQISDDGALLLSKAIPKSSIEKLFLNMNMLTSFGADQLVESIKQSSLRYIGLRGNENVFSYSRQYLNWVISVCHSKWYANCITLLSTRYVPRLSYQSAISRLPNELLRKVCEMLSNPEELIDDSFDIIETQDEAADLAEFEEDMATARIHHKRRCSSVTSLLNMELAMETDDPFCEW